MYQKILIGIAVGALFGLMLGPQSLVLKKDTLHVTVPEKMTIYRSPDGQGVTLPSGPPVNLEIREKVSAEGQEWYKVSWKISARQLLDSKILEVFSHNEPSVEVTKKKKGASEKLKAGDVVTAFVKVSEAPPKASSLGLAVMKWVSPVGEIFLRMILMLVVPMVFTMLVVGVATMGSVKSLGKLGLVACFYALLTSSVAILIGGGLALLLMPGKHVDPGTAALLASEFKFLTSDAMAVAGTAPDIVEFIVNIVPDNPLHSMASSPPNILQIMFFAILFGVALTMVPKKRSEQVVGLMDKVSRILTMVLHMFMKVAPIGVACLIAQTVGSTGFRILDALGLYMLVVLLGLGLYAVFIVGFVVYRFTTVGVLDFWKAIWPAELIAFGTASSSATLPVSMECAEENLGISNRIASFAIPLGSSINMDGTALFQAVAVVFIAQVFGVELTVPVLVTAFVATLLASIGTASVPSAGLVALALICSTIGIPAAGIAIIIGIDRLLDMFRSPINVATDLAGALVLAKFSAERVRVLKPEEDVENSGRGFEKRLEVKQTPYQSKAEAEEAKEEERATAEEVGGEEEAKEKERRDAKSEEQVEAPDNVKVQEKIDTEEEEKE